MRFKGITKIRKSKSMACALLSVVQQNTVPEHFTLQDTHLVASQIA